MGHFEQNNEQLFGALSYSQPKHEDELHPSNVIESLTFFFETNVWFETFHTGHAQTIEYLKNVVETVCF